MILSYITLYVLLSATIRNEIRDGRVDKGDKPGMGGGGVAVGEHTPRICPSPTVMAPLTH